jgi:uncharacterized YccA/Bax inhibitor family protein
MQQDKSGNPALSKSAMDRVMEIESVDHATVGGTIFKTAMLVVLVFIAGAFSWRLAASSSSTLTVLLFGSMIAALGFGLAASFAPKTTPITAPLYAVAEGFLLGAISFWANDAVGGIVLQAIALTGVIFFSTLFLYQARIVRVTEKFKSIVMIATLGIFLYYMLAFVASFFGSQLPLIYDSGTGGIIFSLIVIFIASLNLLLDFSFVESAAESKAPKVFEWYGAFGLTVTLIWLYIEILRLLLKTRN